MQIDKQKLLDYIEQRQAELGQIVFESHGLFASSEALAKRAELSDLISLINEGKFDMKD